MNWIRVIGFVGILVIIVEVGYILEMAWGLEDFSRWG